MRQWTFEIRLLPGMLNLIIHEYPFNHLILGTLQGDHRQQHLDHTLTFWCPLAGRSIRPISKALRIHLPGWNRPFDGVNLTLLWRNLYVASNRRRLYRQFLSLSSPLSLLFHLLPPLYLMTPLIGIIPMSALHHILSLHLRHYRDRQSSI
ncbi:hypothetical protein GYMLUDRAFT_920321 [Collybiopsis luxurians FD-317 M1]|uniref:Unplaced genomic scaffold GYMLUscaffold_72, whole genome shotgun sequence n=1 Tax=Collybiopsis luxurians FD-317 M1 TaxID=944289 RepID=A0A0D0C841_9AGAR|nr:hypothetical protein GYMLUDRAFT_920321 [Collybiopsis luxurians FD-317 M1]